MFYKYSWYIIMTTTVFLINFIDNFEYCSLF